MKRLLVVESITKRFCGLIAVNNVSFELERGDFLGLIRPNGDCKTITLRVILGN